MFQKIIACIFGGLLLGVLGIFLATAFAASNKGGAIGAISFLIFFGIAILISISSENGAKAWRRILITSSIISFLLPISAIIYSFSFMATKIDRSDEFAGAQAVGAAIGGSLVTGLYSIFGFFLGVVFLIIGLLIGREKTIVYINK